MIKIKIGERVKELRILKKHINQEDFAKLLTWDNAYLSRVESGKQNITIENLLLICNVLGITLKDFFNTFDTPIVLEGVNGNGKKKND